MFKHSVFTKAHFRTKVVSLKAKWVVREEVGAGGRNEPSLVCTYE
jgi:hypothetical protein